jgi:hypothetical protein
MGSLDDFAHMNPAGILIDAVRTSQDLPADVRSHAGEARGIEESCFDESYIQFLDEQICLSLRGPEWTTVLRRRRESLRSFCGLQLVSGHIHSGRFDTWVKIDPKTRAVVFGSSQSMSQRLELYWSQSLFAEQ